MTTNGPIDEPRNGYNWERSLLETIEKENPEIRRRDESREEYERRLGIFSEPPRALFWKIFGTMAVSVVAVGLALSYGGVPSLIASFLGTATGTFCGFIYLRRGVERHIYKAQEQALRRVKK